MSDDARVDNADVLYAIALVSGPGCALDWSPDPGDLDADEVNPSSIFGKICWWLWQQNETYAVDMAAGFVRTLVKDSYGFDSVLSTVLRGLPSALPPDAPRAEIVRMQKTIGDQAHYR